MKNQTLKFAIVVGALALGACSAESSDNDERLSSIFGDHQQSLDADGHADCDAIHAALLQNGIDPALLDPEIVREACIDTPDSDRATCDVVAYSCFGPQDDCNDPPPPVDRCEQLWNYVQPGMDPDQDPAGGDYDLQRLLEECATGQIDGDICELVYECIGQPPVEPPTHPDICDLMDQWPSGADEAEFFQICMDHGYSDDECANAHEICDGTDPGDPNLSPDQCEELRAHVDTDSAPDEIYQVCVQIGYSSESCQSAASQCFGDVPVDPAVPSDDCAILMSELEQYGYRGSADGEFDLQECLAIVEGDLCFAVEQACF